jgi:hypothetical protein
VVRPSTTLLFDLASVSVLAIAEADTKSNSSIAFVAWLKVSNSVSIPNFKASLQFFKVQSSN